MGFLLCGCRVWLFENIPDQIVERDMKITTQLDGIVQPHVCMAFFIKTNDGVVGNTASG